MSDYDDNGYNYHSKIVEVDGDTLYIQGNVDDPISMFRDINDLLECERDKIQKDLLEDDKE